MADYDYSSDDEIIIEPIMWNYTRYYIAEDEKKIYTTEVYEKFENDGLVDDYYLELPKWSILYTEYKEHLRIKYKNEKYRKLIRDWKEDYAVKVQRKRMNRIGEWFLECKYNPQYKYCRDRVDELYDDEYEPKEKSDKEKILDFVAKKKKVLKNE